MVVNVREKTIEEVEERLSKMLTTLNKLSYLESVLRVSGTTFEVKRFLYKRIANLYEDRKLFEKAARAMGNRAAIEVSPKEKLDSYICAAELFCKSGRVEDADEMFNRAMRDLDDSGKAKVQLARKNIYLLSAQSLEGHGKPVSALKFYERLVKTRLDNLEKQNVKVKLISMYRKLGRFKDAKLVEGL